VRTRRAYPAMCAQKCHVRNTPMIPFRFRHCLSSYSGPPSLNDNPGSGAPHSAPEPLLHVGRISGTVRAGWLASGGAGVGGCQRMSFVSATSADIRHRGRWICGGKRWRLAALARREEGDIHQSQRGGLRTVGACSDEGSPNSAQGDQHAANSADSPGDMGPRPFRARIPEPMSAYVSLNAPSMGPLVKGRAQATSGGRGCRLGDSHHVPHPPPARRGVESADIVDGDETAFLLYPHRLYTPPGRGSQAVQVHTAGNVSQSYTAILLAQWTASPSPLCTIVQGKTVRGERGAIMEPSGTIRVGHGPTARMTVATMSRGMRSL
jgi:hypothetical protein